MRRRFFLLLAIAACTAASSPAADQHNHDLRRIAALLDYVAADYGGAVRDGAVVDDGEYREQLAFLAEVTERIQALPEPPHGSRDDLGRAVGQAWQVAQSHGSAAAVSAMTRAAREALLRDYELGLGPSSAPSAERGPVLFAQNCATCHGATGGGDGPAAATLRPPPRSFRDRATTASLSPVRAFSAVSDGVSGTAMVGFTSLSEADRWSLAFYVVALRHDDALARAGRPLVEGIPALAGLDFVALADLREVDLEDRLHTAGIADHDRPAVLAYLRRVAPFQTGSIAEVRRGLGEARRAYSAGDAATAKRRLTDAYLDGFEPLEARLLVGAPELVRRIEDRFLALREGIDAGMPPARFDADVATLETELEAADARLHGETSSWSAALAAFVVVVREAVESVLLIMLLLGLVKRAGEEADRKAVHLGWVGALGAGVVTWFASAAVVALGGGNRELVEGVVALFAVVVLLYAGHFVLARIDAQRRIAALKRRFASASPRRRGLVLFAFSFVAVYREAFEIVLFLRAILLGAPSAGASVAMGAAAGLVACIALFAIFARIGRRLNAGALLAIGGGLLCVLAFVLAGKGMRSLQEAGVVGVSAFDGPRVDLLGIYPTLQTIAAQALVASFVVVAFVLPRRDADGNTAVRGAES